MAAPKFDRDRAIRILLDAADMGDPKACKNYKITSQTLRNYRKRLENDAEFLQTFAVKKKELDEGWKLARRSALRAGIRKLEQLIERAGVKQLRDVAGAVKILGDLDVVANVLDDEQPGTDREGEPPAPPAGQPPGATATTH